MSKSDTTHCETYKERKNRHKHILSSHLLISVTYQSVWWAYWYFPWVSIIFSLHSSLFAMHAHGEYQVHYHILWYLNKSSPAGMPPRISDQHAYSSVSCSMLRCSLCSLHNPWRTLSTIHYCMRWQSLVALVSILSWTLNTPQRISLVYSTRR